MGRFDSMLKPLERRFAEKAECLIFPSESKARLFLKTVGISLPYVVVANAPLKQPRLGSKFLNNALHLNRGKRDQTVLYQGSIGPGKGLETLVRSMPHWPEGVVLKLLGIVRPRRYVDALLDLARDLGVGSRLFYLGLVNYDDLFDVTRSADLGVFLPTSTISNNISSGTAANKILEYMACGVPVLVSAFPALKELIEKTGAGLAVDPTDPKAVGLAIKELLTDNHRWDACSENGRKAHLEKYHFENQFKPVLEVLNRSKEM
jgi:glycosyltransferase involved in cell wall biosynthesis